MPWAKLFPTGPIKTSRKSPYNLLHNLSDQGIKRSTGIYEIKRHYPIGCHLFQDQRYVMRYFLDGVRGRMHGFCMGPTELMNVKFAWMFKFSR